MVGASIRQGPHHSAQKSTTTGPLDTISSKLSLVKVIIIFSAPQIYSYSNKINYPEWKATKA